jgi:very-short-patch-repair endonuclease
MHKQKPKLTEYARTMRKQPTEAEARLWHFLRAKQFFGLKFRRQQPWKNYIVDFVCHEVKLIVELDGGQHNQADKLDYDQQRTAILELEGYRVLRFWNNDVLLNTDAVLEGIRLACLQERTLPLTPSHQGRGNESFDCCFNNIGSTLLDRKTGNKQNGD